MAQNKPIVPIRLYVNSLQGFWPSFLPKMNAAPLRSVKDSEREWGARTSKSVATLMNSGTSPSTNTIPKHDACEGFTTGGQVLYSPGLLGFFRAWQDCEMLARESS